MKKCFAACDVTEGIVTGGKQTPCEQNMNSAQNKVRGTDLLLGGSSKAPHGRGSCLVACDVTEGVEP